MEEIELEYFLDAYFLSGTRELAVLSSSERPDFICSASDGSTVGLELVKGSLSWSSLASHFWPAAGLVEDLKQRELVVLVESRRHQLGFGLVIA